MHCPRCHHLNAEGAPHCGRCGAPLAAAPNPVTPAPRVALGLGERVLDRFELVTILGEGGMSTVYEAIDLDLGRRLALKVLSPALADDAKARERLIREASALARIRHPHVLQIYDVLELGGGIALALELVAGGTLTSLFAAGPLSPAQAISIMDPVLDGLTAIHDAGLVHRDLKPSNVLLTADGQPKIADLGIARDPNAVALTTPGALLGTPAYMSPEQIRGLALGPETDVYSLGVVLYELLAAHPPFTAARDRELLAAHLGQAPPLEALPPTVPTALREVIGQALEKDPSRRFRSAAALRVALAATRREVGSPLELGDNGREEQQAAKTPPAAAATPGAGLAVGTQVGEYRVCRLLGEGGMGRVYAAEERLSGRRVALKILRPEIARSTEGRRLFLNEIAVLARLDHPNIVRSLACTELAGELVLVLELLQGRTLRQHLLESGPLPPPAAVRVALQIALALTRAHATEPPIVHRDLKPENVMLLHDDTVKVMDFGIAKVLGAVPHTATLSIGTLAYLSPEQIDARPVDARSDLYGLGLVLYEMLAGSPPFTAESPRELLNRQCTEPPPPLPPAVRSASPPALLNLLARLLEKAPERRPRSATEVVAALESLAVDARPASRENLRGADGHPLEPSRHRNVPWPLALLVILALSACAGTTTYAVRVLNGLLGGPSTSPGQTEDERP